MGEKSISLCEPVGDISISVLVNFSCLKMPIISVVSQQKCTALCVLPYKEVISSVSTVNDKNNHAGVHFRKFTGAIVVCRFDKNLKT